MNAEPRRNLLNYAIRLLGLLLLIVPFLPIRNIAGELRGTHFAVTPTEWLLGVAIVFAASWLMSVLLPEQFLDRLAQISARLFAVEGRSYVTVLLGLLTAGLTLSSFLVFHNRPVIVDSTVQFFQAEIFAAGRFVAPAPKQLAFFIIQHMIMDGNVWFGQYPPGHSLLLALGILARAPWATGIALAVTTALFAYLFVREVYDLTTARLSLLLLVGSPFFFFMATSYMNHCSALTFTSISFYCFARWSKSFKLRWLVCIGLALGLVCISRPLSGIAVGIPLGLAALKLSLASGRIRTLPIGALGFLPVVSFGLLYNHCTTGDALVPGYIKLWGGEHGVGFHRSPWGYTHTPQTGFWNELTDLSLLNEYLFEWPIPSLIPIGLYFLAPFAKRQWDNLLFASFLTVPACYFFYWFRGNFLGPRFLYETVIFVVPLTARAFLFGLPKLKPYRFKIPYLFRETTYAAVLGYVTVIVIGYQALFGFPGKFRSYYFFWQAMKVDVVAEARAKGIDAGLIFIANDWGERLLANLLEAGVPAAMAEEAYRTCDHCLLQELLDEAMAKRNSAGETSAEELNRKVQALVDAKMTLAHPNLNNDPTLKIRPGVPLTARCADEVRYDKNGYTTYFPHLISNEPLLNGSFIVARDLRNRNRELMALYPGKRAYLYRNDDFSEIKSVEPPTPD